MWDIIRNWYSSLLIRCLLLMDAFICVDITNKIMESDDGIHTICNSHLDIFHCNKPLFDSLLLVLLNV